MRAVLLSLALAACSSEIEPSPDGGGEVTADARPPQTVDITGPDVLPHVQAFADAVCTELGACRISTYEGHSPVASRAIDILVSDAYGERPRDGDVFGDAVAQFALDQAPMFGITYVIFRQRYNDGGGWEPMEDRGSITQNHFDHVHVSFDASL